LKLLFENVRVFRFFQFYFVLFLVLGKRL